MSARICAQEGCRNEAQAGMFSCDSCCPQQPLVLPESKKEEFNIELEAPLKAKLEKLQEFVRENDLMGVLDRRYVLQWLGELDNLRVTRLKANVVKEKNTETWTLVMTVNNKKDFNGKGPYFEEALLTLCENLEAYVIAKAAS